MDIEALRVQIEPFLDDKGYKTDTSMRLNCRSYLKKLLDFMHDNNYPELNETAIMEYLKKYEGKTQFGTRKLRVQEFYEYVKGVRTMSIPYENAEIETENEQVKVKEAEHIPDMAVSDSMKLESNTEVEVSSELKRQSVAMKGEKEKNKRKQISVYLNVETYEQLQDISYFTGFDIAKLSERAILKLIESNKEQLNKAQELKSRISTMGFEI